MKKSSDSIGIRTRDLPVCDAVPQPLRHRVPLIYTNNFKTKRYEFWTKYIILIPWKWQWMAVLKFDIWYLFAAIGFRPSGSGRHIWTKIGKDTARKEKQYTKQYKKLQKTEYA
jgi:hypothetical protein